MRKFGSVNELVNTLKPEYPVYCIRPSSIKKSVEFFKSNFPGKVLYAVKTNPNEKVIKIINSGNNIDRIIESAKKTIIDNHILELQISNMIKFYKNILNK